MELIGLDRLKDHLSDVINNADIYKKGGASVPNIMMNLSRNNGQSVVAYHIASMLYENGLRRFCGLDILLEYRPDGNLNGLKHIFEDIKSNAVYTNDYEGVVAMDITALAGYLNEYQIEFFLKHLEEVSRNATLIIYYEEMVAASLGNYVDITVEPYSNRDYSEIVVQNIRERGIRVDSEEGFEDLLFNEVGRYNVSNAREAVAVAEDLVFYADYSDPVPKIDAKAIGMHLENGKDLT